MGRALPCELEVVLSEGNAGGISSTHEPHCAVIGETITPGPMGRLFRRFRIYELVLDARYGYDSGVVLAVQTSVHNADMDTGGFRFPCDARKST